MVILKNIIRYFWAVNVILLFFVAYFLAGLVNFNLSRKYLALPAPTGPANYASLPSGGFNYHPSSDRIIERNVFGTIDLTLLQGATAAEPAITKVNAGLIGIMYFYQGSQLNRAMILLKDQNLSDAYRIGDELSGGAKIEDIQPKKVILSLGGGGKQELLLEEFAGELPGMEEYVYQSPYGKMSEKEAAAALMERRKSLGIDDRIKRVSETYFKIERSAISDALGNMNDLLTHARMVPNFVEDESGRRTDGFRVLQVKAGGVFEKLGIRTGDVIEKINGAPMDNIQKGFELMQQLQFEKRFEIDVLRGSRPLLISYEIIE